FQKAGTILPLDPKAQAQLKLAEKGHADAIAVKVQQLVKSAEQHIKLKQLDLATKDVNEALLLAPKDAEVLRVQKLLDKARLDSVGELKTKMAYDDAIKQAQSLLDTNPSRHSTNPFQKAGTILPLDPKAQAQLKL